MRSIVYITKSENDFFKGGLRNNQGIRIKYPELEKSSLQIKCTTI